MNKVYVLYSGRKQGEGGIGQDVYKLEGIFTSMELAEEFRVLYESMFTGEGMKIEEINVDPNTFSGWRGGDSYEDIEVLIA